MNAEIKRNTITSIFGELVDHPDLLDTDLATKYDVTFDVVAKVRKEAKTIGAGIANDLQNRMSESQIVERRRCGTISDEAIQNAIAIVKSNMNL